MPDPNVLYVDEVHIGLVVLSILFLLVLGILPIFLLVPRLTFRIPYVRNLKPLIDAFIAPFAPGREFWVGFRMIFRLVFSAVAIISNDQGSVVYLTVLVAVLAITETVLRPFKSAVRNAISRSIMTNLTITSIFFVHVNTFNVNNDEAFREINVFGFYIYLIQLCVLIIYYIIIRFECSRKPCEKALGFIKAKIGLLRSKIQSKNEKKKKKRSVHVASVNLATETTIDGPEDGEFVETDFIAYREELLDGIDSVSQSAVVVNKITIN